MGIWIIHIQLALSLSEVSFMSCPISFSLCANASAHASACSSDPPVPTWLLP